MSNQRKKAKLTFCSIIDPSIRGMHWYFYQNHLDILQYTISGIFLSWPFECRLFSQLIHIARTRYF